MKRNSTFHVFVFLMTILIFNIPFVALAQQNPTIFETIVMAEQDAQSDVKKMVWFGAGCLVSGGTLLALRILIPEDPSFELAGTACILNGAALVGIFTYQPPPPSSRLLGKSPEYVNSYTNAYKAEARKIQSLWGIAGYISGGLVMTGILILEAASE